MYPVTKDRNTENTGKVLHIRPGEAVPHSMQTNTEITIIIHFTTRIQGAEARGTAPREALEKTEVGVINITE